MTSLHQSPTINIMENAARKAGKNLIRDFGELEKLQVSSKSLGNFVTNSDIKSEKIIKETLQYHFPEYGLIMEESGEVQGSEKDHTFIIDPIDGTNNFIHGIPQFSIVIAKLTFGKITDGIIYNPITEEFYWSSKGKGAWLNNTRLRVSNRDKIDHCVIATGQKNNENNERTFSQQQNILNLNATLRCMGSAALDLAFVASGRFDAFWQYNLNLWDIASGILLVMEAGGKITQANGEDWNTSSDSILASNSKIHNNLVDLL
ncbi:MAG: Inositol-1-monophosphatase [Alphaproteobacteria bacterium MarineAlpha5_Bin11]|nr:inositol monophosphatase [Pelagibacteraceae bacterium]PPR43853.1 MAG: Inositol-1-monophosphatase [Alphaproteobacteria bacterium MarineAlpha5_Bin11]|tara:strand:- start:6744 stop:7526 length:783 start_codon:yes stop_codon:yes gene_type:complete